MAKKSLYVSLEEGAKLLKEVPEMDSYRIPEVIWDEVVEASRKFNEREDYFVEVQGVSRTSRKCLDLIIRRNKNETTKTSPNKITRK